MEMDIPKSLISIPTETKLKISDMIDDVLAGYECKEEERAWLEVQEEIKRQLDERLDKRKDDTMKNEDDVFFTFGEQTADKWLGWFKPDKLARFGWIFEFDDDHLLSIRSASIQIGKKNFRTVKSNTIISGSDIGLLNPDDFMVSYVANSFWKVRLKDEEN